MPYILISTQIRLETGPTMVGDEYSDLSIMNYLGARKTTMLGNNFSEYHVDEPPRLVLDKLDKMGFRVVSMTGVGQTLVWCLHKETSDAL
ncbi:GTP cyclohydrolase 1 feedback regulatory protein isoform X1 [Sinocyclocheilus rhinocerous]|uniref:GTP cyclohydrolase 1 feedback regulatory protein n=1 Tax=Sinocyclocheilus rhinocerous TaxID=307959 RepID=A0A673HB13_9TELE|nr:PREDICTED: GTP cyclohydrolase 1 feedback regulatory protein isoform X1 [Sinocyclocheilus rhinocerous]